MTIDVAITATCRPEILRRTLESFIEYLFRDTDHLRLILNIDPIGNCASPNDTLLVAREYFDNIIYNIPQNPDFNTAFRYVLNRSESRLVFHLQDDWVITYPLDFDEMVYLMMSEENLASLRLSMFPTRTNFMINWGQCRFPWNGRYFECPVLDRIRFGFCGHPSLLSKEFLAKTVPLMCTRHNPESQFHTFFRIVNEVKKWNFGVFADPDREPNIIDIGREWMAPNGWKKNSDKTHTVWLKHECDYNKLRN